MNYGEQTCDNYGETEIFIIWNQKFIFSLFS